jgi:hypothetical protein
MFSLLDNIQGEDFVKFISTCFCHADTFSLSKNRWPTKNQSGESARILQRLRPYHTRTLHTDTWFSMRVLNWDLLEVYLFEATPDSKNILLDEYDSIFYADTYWEKPEDLCFFKNGRLLAGSVTHEQICYVYEQKDVRDFMEQIKLCGRWEQCPTDLAGQIQISK